MLIRGGGSSNVHVVLKGGSSKCSCPFTRGREGVKNVPNPVHVVCERPRNKIPHRLFEVYKKSLKKHQKEVL